MFIVFFWSEHQLLGFDGIGYNNKHYFPSFRLLPRSPQRSTALFHSSRRGPATVQHPSHPRAPSSPLAPSPAPSCLPLRPLPPPPSSSSSAPAQPSLPLALSERVPPPSHLPSPTTHGILGTLSAQPPQALLEDDEEPAPAGPETPPPSLPLSQMHMYMQSLQPRATGPTQPLQGHAHSHSPTQAPSQLTQPMQPTQPTHTLALDAGVQKHGSGHTLLPQSFTHAPTTQQQKSAALQQKLQQMQHHQPKPQSPCIKTEPFATGRLMSLTHTHTRIE